MDGIEARGGERVSGSGVGCRGKAFFGCLDLFPVAEDRGGRTLDRGIDLGAVSGGTLSLFAEDVGMTADELVVEMVEHVGDGEMAFVGGHFGIEEDLQQQIAQLFREVRKVSALNGVEDLVGFFEGVFADGVEGLLAVPGAAAGSAQAGHDGYRLLEEARRMCRIGGGWLGR